MRFERFVQTCRGFQRWLPSKGADLVMLGIVIASKFPNVAHDDQVDAMTQVLLRWHQASQQTILIPSAAFVRISPY
jgi:hypothetical protein